MSKIKGRGFINYLLELFGRVSIDDVTDKEIDMITDFILVKNDKDEDYNFIDLEMFPNLREVVLINFKIDNFETNVLNRCKKLRKVEFVDCDIVSKSRLLKENITELGIDYSKENNSNSEEADGLKIVLVQNVKLFDTKKIGRLINLEELRVNYSKLKTANYLSKVVKLKFLNLTGSKYDKNLEKSLENGLLKGIHFEK